MALAVPITFIHEGGGGAGTIGNFFFEPTGFVITATGDTDDRTSFGNGFSIVHLTASIAIDGVGTFDFITGTRTFVNNSLSLVGFSRASGTDLFDGPTNADFAAWDMLSSIGPIPGTGELLQWQLSPINTSGGVLVFNDERSTEASFTAIVGTPVPVPGSIVLVMLGLVGMRAARGRRG